jgi:alanine dehydrogenase
MTQSRDSRDALWLTEDDVRACLTLNEAIEALSVGIRLEPLGEAANLEKVLATWGTTSSMHALGSLMNKRGYVGFKTWANTPNGAAAVFSLFDAENGALCAVMEAALLGQLRTAGISGVATKVMADPAADQLSLIGTGVQALMQAAAIASTRKLTLVRVFSPTAEHRRAFVARARALLDIEVQDCPSVEACTEGAAIVTLITRAKVPFLSADHLACGAHINAAGAILPANAELCPDVLERAAIIAVDSLANARKGSRELAQFCEADPTRWEQVTTLGKLMVENRRARAPDALTVFKPMGMGLSDLAVAIPIYEKALAEGRGVKLPSGMRGPPAWTMAA